MPRETGSEEHVTVTVRVPPTALAKGIVTREGITKAAQDYVEAAVDAYLTGKAAARGIKLGSRITGTQFGDGNTQVNNF